MTRPVSKPAAERNWSILLGAAFLMATSAIGPGFLTQTATFTQSLGASFGFVILLSVLIDLVAQVNIWRIIAVTLSNSPSRSSPLSTKMQTKRSPSAR